MDTSKTYVNMCSAAVLGRRPFLRWVPIIGDVYYNKFDRATHVVVRLPLDRTWLIWLPRFDQLFELVAQRYPESNKTACALHRFYQHILAHPPELRSSPEQLMLQFLLAEQFSAKYLGGSWFVRKLTKDE